MPARVARRTRWFADPVRERLLLGLEDAPVLTRRCQPASLRSVHSSTNRGLRGLIAQVAKVPTEAALDSMLGSSSPRPTTRMLLARLLLRNGRWLSGQAHGHERTVAATGARSVRQGSGFTPWGTAAKGRADVQRTEGDAADHWLSQAGIPFPHRCCRAPTGR
jgi:hypothetical protein